MDEARAAERFARAARDAHIVNAWINGASIDTLAKQHHLTAERVRQIVNARDGAADERLRRGNAQRSTGGPPHGGTSQPFTQPLRGGMSEHDAQDRSIATGKPRAR